jgi:hypothetical protein
MGVKWEGQVVVRREKLVVHNECEQVWGRGGNDPAKFFYSLLISQFNQPLIEHPKPLFLIIAPLQHC